VNLPPQRAELALKLKPLFAAKARENKILSGEMHGRGKVYPNSDKPTVPFHTDKEVAKAAGMSPDTIFRAEKVLRDGTERLVGNFPPCLWTAWALLHDGSAYCSFFSMSLINWE